MPGAAARRVVDIVVNLMLRPVATTSPCATSDPWWAALALAQLATTTETRSALAGKTIYTVLPAAEVEAARG